MMGAMSNPSHCVAVIGGAAAGSEVAAALAERGIEVTVFDMNPRPYGKVEDGLPRWHVALRHKEYQGISKNLSTDGVGFVPNTKVGRDIDVRELVDDWGFSGVVLACGAWRDRPLAIEGAESYVDKGLIYQNPFIIWFNHNVEAGYQGPVFESKDGALVVGGGLASIDVAKVLMLETTLAKLRERGIEEDLVEMEVKGIPKILARHGIEFEELGIEGCTLLYRRSDADMPLMEMPDNADEKRQEKVRMGRQKMLAKAMDKFRFKFEPLCMPEGLITEGDQLVGLTLRRTKIENGRVVPLDETFEARGSYVISSIGSIPEPTPGIPMRGELFEFTDWDLGRLDGYPTVFSAGNVVTGKGNIVASRKHAREVSQTVIEAFLGIGDGDESQLLEADKEATRKRANAIANAITIQPPIGSEQLEALRKRIADRQSAVSYTGDYKSWIEKVTPADMT
jgi:NADPH-dependent glutamate synthase beta subunit-like oxidoreductase